LATSASTLITRCRRQLRDFPDQDALTASVASNATALTVADTSIYFVNEYIEVDQEAFRVKALASGTSLTVPAPPRERLRPRTPPHRPCC
jgi:hypothetical protein